MTDCTPPRNRRRWIQALFALGILGLFLVAAEAALRMTHLFGAALSWSEPDPELGYRYTPGKRYWYHKENDHPIEGRINRYGWRDRDWTLEKPPGVYRVAVLGDSFVEAFQVESDRTFLAEAERRVNAEPMDVRAELMNFGRSGYTQTEQRIVLGREVVRFSPDLVVLLFYPGNDIEDVSRETSPESDRPFFFLRDDGALVLDTSFTQARRYRVRCVLNRLKQHSALVSLAGDRYNMYQTVRSYEAKRKQEGRQSSTLPQRAHAGAGPFEDPHVRPERQPVTGYLSLCTNSPDPAYLRSYELSKALIREMASLCKEQGIEFLIVVLFDPDYRPVVEEELKAMDPSYNPRFFEEDMEVFARELGVHFLELHEAARGHIEQGGLPLKKVHLNYKGHEVVGEALADTLARILEKRGLGP